MSDLNIDRVFETVGNARDLGGFTPRLGIGKHKLLLKRFGVKQSSKGKGKIIEADFVVLQSTVHSAGELRGWAWFPDSQGWAGEYEAARAKTFIETVGQCIGDDSPVSAIGAALASPAQFGMGLCIEVVISAQTDKSGNPKTNAKGEIYTNAQWIPVKQTIEEIQAARAELENMTPSAPPEVKAAAQAVAAQATAAQVAPAPAPAPAPAAPTTAPASSLLAALRK